MEVTHSVCVCVCVCVCVRERERERDRERDTGGECPREYICEINVFPFI